MSRTIDEERDAARTANRGGVAFLFVHGITWLAAAILTFVLSVEQAALVVLFQGLVAFPASLVLERLLGFRFIPAKDNAVVSLFVLIAMTQGLGLPGSIVVLNLTGVPQLERERVPMTRSPRADRIGQPVTVAGAACGVATRT